MYQPTEKTNKETVVKSSSTISVTLSVSRNKAPLTIPITIHAIPAIHDSGDIKEHIEKLSGKEKKPSLRAQLAQDKETVKAAPKKQAAKTKNKGLEV